MVGIPTTPSRLPLWPSACSIRLSVLCLVCKFRTPSPCNLPMDLGSSACSRFCWSGTCPPYPSKPFPLAVTIMPRFSEWRDGGAPPSSWLGRSLAVLPRVYRYGASVVSGRKLRSWLLQFNPLLREGWSWSLWLSAGRGPLLPSAYSTNSLAFGGVLVEMSR